MAFSHILVAIQVEIAFKRWVLLFWFIHFGAGCFWSELDKSDYGVDSWLSSADTKGNGAFQLMMITLRVVSGANISLPMNDFTLVSSPDLADKSK